MVGSGELPRLCNNNPRGYVVELDGGISSGMHDYIIERPDWLS